MISATKQIPIYSVEIRDSGNEFKFQAEINQLEKSVFLALSNPEYQISQNIYEHLKDIKMIKNVKNIREAIGGDSWGANSKTNKTMLGYFIAWKRRCSSNILFTKTSLHDYEKLCSLD